MAVLCFHFCPPFYLLLGVQGGHDHFSIRFLGGRILRYLYKDYKNGVGKFSGVYASLGLGLGLRGCDLGCRAISPKPSGFGGWDLER